MRDNWRLYRRICSNVNGLRAGALKRMERRDTQIFVITIDRMLLPPSVSISTRRETDIWQLSGQLVLGQ